MKKTFVVSCQALKDEPLYGGDIMTKMAKAAIIGGADWIRASQINNIENMLENINVPIIGIIKEVYPSPYDGGVFITPTIKEMKKLIDTGVHMIALDATLRKRPKESLKEIVDFFFANKKPNQKLVADCSDINDMKNAIKLNFDYIGTTLCGYTNDSKNKHTPYNNFEIIKKVKKLTDIPIIAEGHVDTPKLARQAYESGASIVVVGSLITRPRIITKTFIKEIGR